MGQCGLQFIGILRRNEDAAGVFGDTGKAFMGLILKVEADDMGREFHALPGQLLGQRARVGLTGFQTIGNEHHSGGVVAIGQEFRGVLDRGGNRCLSFRADAVHRADEACPVERPRLDQGLDVAAVAFRAMPIGDEAEIDVVGPAGHEIGHHVTRDLDLAGAVDLAPHRAGGVINDDHVFRRCGERQGHGDGGGRDQCRLQSFHHGVSFRRLFHAGRTSPLPCTPDPADAPMARAFSLRNLPDICSSRASHSGSGC